MIIGAAAVGAVATWATSSRPSAMAARRRADLAKKSTCCKGSNTQRPQVGKDAKSTYSSLRLCPTWSFALPHVRNNHYKESGLTESALPGIVPHTFVQCI